MQYETLLDINEALGQLEFLPDRVADQSPSTDQWTAALADYRDGLIFGIHYAGHSGWERHPTGDEIVLVVEGTTTITLLIDGSERSHLLSPMQLIVIPQGAWHRFDTTEPLKALTVTPTPTEHVADPAAVPGLRWR